MFHLPIEKESARDVFADMLRDRRFLKNKIEEAKKEVASIDCIKERRLYHLRIYAAIETLKAGERKFKEAVRIYQENTP